LPGLEAAPVRSASPEDHISLAEVLVVAVPLLVVLVVDDERAEGRARVPRHAINVMVFPSVLLGTCSFLTIR
jgi:transcriptional regulator of met regulon